MNSTLGRTASFTFGVISYLVFLAAFILSIAFVANLPWAPARLDGEPLLPLGWALAIDAALLVAASLVYRVSRGAAQSARVLLGSLATLALLALWQPLGGELWRVEGPALRQVLAAAFGLGGALLLYAVLLGDQLAAGGLHAAARRLFGLAEEGREEAGEAPPAPRCIEPGCAAAGLGHAGTECRSPGAGAAGEPGGLPGLAPSARRAAGGGPHRAAGRPLAAPAAGGFAQGGDAGRPGACGLRNGRIASSGVTGTIRGGLGGFAALYPPYGRRSSCWVPDRTVAGAPGMWFPRLERRAVERKNPIAAR